MARNTAPMPFDVAEHVHAEARDVAGIDVGEVGAVVLLELLRRAARS